MLRILKARPVGVLIFALVCASRPTLAADHYGDDDYSSSPEKLYFKFCAVCHGEKGDGQSRARQSLNPPPRDFTTAQAAAELSRERMIVSATYGRPGTAMVGWKRRLSDEQIAGIVDFIRGNFMRLPDSRKSGVAGGVATTSTAMPGKVDMSLPFPNGLVGDVQKGKTFYMQNCHVCHGDNGDGHGIRAAFIKPPPRNFLSEESRHLFNRPALFHAISVGKQGTVMPAWKTVLSDQEIANVAEFVFESFIDPKAFKKKLSRSEASQVNR
jgi:mono/diheme cytochrome c family protein